MKESKTIKEYSGRLLDIVNNIRLLGFDFSNDRIVQKFLVTVPEKFEATIASMDNSRDLSSITLAEFLNALQAQEQRRLLRQEGSVERAFQAKNYKGNKYSQNNDTCVFSPCPYCKKNNHPHKCWWRPDMKCHKCGQLGHVEKICKPHHQHLEVKVAEDQLEEEQLFATSCFTTNNSKKKGWLIDSGCTNHMTHD